MAKTWKVILIFFALMLLLGIVSIGVGIITGGDSERINDVFTARYAADIDYVNMIIENVSSTVHGILDSLNIAI